MYSFCDSALDAE
ncbi:MAG: hypothetical protein QG656_2660, partial [Candidatus Hydrogenedentes bacterium]|nr:hypothetical protein [Candidatus Hydrogenedentota bacterium]